MSEDTSTSLNQQDIGTWNQFEANKKKFGVKSTFDENLYTKKLDMSSMSRAQVERAESLAREIEGNQRKSASDLLTHLTVSTVPFIQIS